MLRPLGVGDVLDRTFTVYRTKPLLFIGLSAIWYLLLVLFFIVLAAVIFAGALAAFARQTATPSPEQIAGAVAGIIGFVIVAVIVAILLFSAQSAALVHAAARRYLAKEVTIGESFRAGLSASVRLFIAGLLVFLAIVCVWAVLFIVAAITNQFLAYALAFVAAIVATAYLASSWLVAPVIVVMEKMGPIAALSRSWRLSAGNRWRIFGIQVLLVILNVVLSILIGGIFGGLAAAGQTQPGQLGVSSVVQTLVNLASTIIWAPVEWIAFTILYYDLRVRKEAFDLQLAAEALPQS
ncbi:MAG TPA: glycerophosphoryl diester phosphodiesterase membrane domain-containing protein [Candidatus Bathyarchaeia archaeon]|nr:glycerophosphoryl diester phosphodiesterase membrane domain-containing protein [Candidatus Bathyarchaeia archaeon]